MRVRDAGLAVSCFAATLLAACASDGPPDRGRGGPLPRPRGPQLFISLSGQPFRAEPGQPYPSAAWFAQADTDHDGRLTRAEARADAAAFFRKLDANHDGVIDSFEVGDYEQKMVPEILGAYFGGGPRRDEAPGGPEGGGSRGGRGGGPRGGGPGRGGPPGRGDGPGSGDGGGFEGAAPYEMTNEPEPVAAADLDLSGRITLDEFLRTVDRRFDEIDKSHSGSIARADLPKTPIQQLVDGPDKRRRRGPPAP